MNSNIRNQVNLQGQLIMMGPKGYSAYELAVQEGFDGTVDDWLESLKGKSPTIKVGEVTLLEPTSEPTIENVGTENEAIFNFGIPKGEYIVEGDDFSLDLSAYAKQKQVDEEIKIRKQTDSNLQSQINSLASGSPKGVFESLEELKQNNPDTGVYLLSNGHIYSWNKNQIDDPIDLGIYQAVQIQNYSIDNIKIKPNDITIENSSFYKDLLNLATEIKEGYILTGYNTSTYLPGYSVNSDYNCYVFNNSDLLKYGDYKNYFGYKNSPLYNVYVCYTSGVKAFNATSGGINDTNNNLSKNNMEIYDNFVLCMPKTNCYFKTQKDYFKTDDILKDLSVNIEIKNQNIKDKIKGNNINLNITDLTKQHGVTILKNHVPSGYSTTQHNVSTKLLDNYTTIIVDKKVFTEFSSLRNIKIKLSDNYSETEQIICGYNTTSDTGFNFAKISLISGSISSFYDSETNIYDWGAFITSDLWYMNNFDVFSFGFYSDEVDFYTETLTELNNSYKFINEKINDNNIMCTVNIFNSIGAIGDSYTAASTKHSNSNWWTDQTNQSYVGTIAKRAGIDFDNYGVGGSTTRSYLTNEKGMTKVLSTPANDFYFLALGINDSEQLGIDYIGTINDIKEDYTQNADTFYGNYGKIISQVLSHNSKARLCMILIPLKSEVKTQFNNAIKSIANHFGIPYINPFDDEFFNSNLYNTKIEGHPTCPGYVGMGLAYERLLSKCIMNNVEYFLYSTVG